MTASAWVGLTELLVITWQMVGLPPPRFQFETVPFVWSRLLPNSKVGFTQKLLGRMSARTNGVPSSRKANPIRHKPEVKEASDFLKPDDFVFFLAESTDVRGTQFRLGARIEVFMVFLLCAFVQVRFRRRWTGVAGHSVRRGVFMI